MPPAPPPISDRDLIAAVLRGQVDAYATLLGRYRDVHTRYAIRMLGNYAAAEDALQASFLRAFGTLARYKEPERYGDWLFRIVINECRSRAMRRSVRERFTGEVAVITAAAPPEADPAVEIQRALDQLDPINREAFILQYVEERPYPEIAALTSANVPAVEARVDRACARLRELLARMYAEHRQGLTKGGSDAHDPGLPFIARIAAPLRRPEVLNDTFDDRLMSKLLRPGDSAEAAPAAEPVSAPTSAPIATSTPEPITEPKTEPRRQRSFALTSALSSALRDVFSRSPSRRATIAIACGVILASFAAGYAVRGSGRRKAPAAKPARPVAPARVTPKTIVRVDTVRVVESDTVHFVRFVFVDEAAKSVSLVGDFNGWNAKTTPLARTAEKGVWTVSVPLTAGRHEYAFVADGKRWSTDRFAGATRDEFGTESSIVPALPVVRTPTPAEKAASASARLEKALPRPIAERVLAKIRDARASGLPGAALESRALKFAAKGVSSADIERAVAQEVEHMATAKALLSDARGHDASDDEVEAGAAALRLGVDTAAIRALAKSASSNRALEVPLYAIGTLVAHEVSARDALARVQAQLRARATDAELEHLAEQMVASRPNGSAKKGRTTVATKAPSNLTVRQAGAPAKSGAPPRPPPTRKSAGSSAKP